MELTTIIPILEQRLQTLHNITPEVVTLYNQLRDLGRVSVEEEEGIVTLSFTTDRQDIDSEFDYLTPISILRSDLYEGREVEAYTIEFRSSQDIIGQLNDIHQLRCRPYSPVFPQLAYFVADKYDTVPIYIQVTDTVPTPCLSRGIQIPEELKRHILSYCSYQQGSEAHYLLNPSVRYLNQSAKQLDSNWNLSDFLTILRDRQRIYRSLPANIYSIQRHLLQFDYVNLTAVQTFEGAYTNFEIHTASPLTEEDIESIFHVPATITCYDEEYNSYQGNLSTSELIGNLNNAAQLMSPGFDRILRKETSYTLDNGNLLLLYPLC